MKNEEFATALKGNVQCTMNEREIIMNYEL